MRLLTAACSRNGHSFRRHAIGSSAEGEPPVCVLILPDGLPCGDSNRSMLSHPGVGLLQPPIGREGFLKLIPLLAPVKYTPAGIVPRQTTVSAVLSPLWPAVRLYLCCPTPCMDRETLSAGRRRWRS